MKKASNIGLSLIVASTISSLYAESTDLGNISVTVTKSEVSTSESPASVEIITAEQISNKEVERVDEALKDVSGVLVRSQGNHTPSSWNNSVSLRGIPMYYRTAVLVDGISINNAFSAGVNWSSIPIDDVEKIEVVKGPFSSLYGGNAMSGVINIIRKEPTKQEFMVKTGYGSNDYVNTELSYKDKFSDTLGISVNYGHKQSNGYISDLAIVSPSAGVGTAVTGQIQTTDYKDTTKYIVGDKGKKSWVQDDVGIKLYYYINSDAKLSLDYNHHEHETEYNSFNTYLTDTSGNPIYSGTLQLDATNKASLSEKSFLFGPNGETSNKVTLNYKDTFNELIDLDAKASYTRYNYWYVSQSSEATVSGGSGTFTDIPNQKLYGSIQLNFSLGDYNFITLGADTTKSNLQKDVNTITNWTDYDSTSTLERENNGESTSYAVFIQDTIDITDNLIAYIGGRYDYWETKGHFNDYSKESYITYAKRDDSSFSPKVSLVFLPTKSTTLRASWGQAFRAPSLSDMYSSWYSGIKLNSASPTLKPETVTSWELGFEQQFSTDTLVKATYYMSVLDDMLYSTDVNSTLSEKRNAGKAEIKGFEIEIKQAITDKIETFANYTYNNTKMIENPSKPTSVGKKLTYVPESQYNIGVSGNYASWNGSLIGSYVDDLYTKDDNSDVNHNVYGTYESYFILNATLGYKIMDYLKASISVNNMLDTEYYQSNKTPGRTVYGELTFKF